MFCVNSQPTACCCCSSASLFTRVALLHSMRITTEARCKACRASRIAGGTNGCKMRKNVVGLSSAPPLAGPSHGQRMTGKGGQQRLSLEYKTAPTRSAAAAQPASCRLRVWVRAQVQLLHDWQVEASESAHASGRNEVEAGACHRPGCCGDGGHAEKVAPQRPPALQRLQRHRSCCFLLFL